MDGGTAQLRVGLLGEFTATHGDRPLDLGGPRQRAVLALLLLARGEVVPADRLAEQLWGDRAPADTAGALQAYVSHLRRRLQPGSAARDRSRVIVSEGRGYAVRLPDDAVDAWRFERLLHRAVAEPEPARAAEMLDEALGLWRGPALTGYADEPWAEAEIARLSELRAVARERLFAARLELGEAALLVPDLEAMVNEEPLREERWRLLVLALYRAQRQADALGALRRARDRLAEELGVDPGPALRDLERQVRAQSPALTAGRRPGGARPPVAATAPRSASAPGAGSAARPGPSVPGPPAPGPPAPGPSAPGRSGPPPAGIAPAARPAAAAGPPPDYLHDRERELAAVRSALDDLLAGQPRLLLVEGPPGIGKTRLLAEARRLAADRGVRVLSARGSQLEKAFGFGSVRQLFEPELAAPDRREHLLGGAAAGARGVFDLAGDSTEGSFAALHGLYWLTVNLTAAGPVLLAVDDLQWCDGASLRFLAYLVRRLEAVPVLVVGTVRTGEPHEDEELLTELALEPAAVVVQPGPLSPEAITTIVGRRLGEPVSPLFAAACDRTTGGNPLLLRQLLRALEADGVHPDAAHADTVVAVGSRAVSSMVLVRLRRLGGDVLAVVRPAAVLGDGASLPAVAALAGLSERDTAAALAVLARAEILRDEQPLAFVHPLVREAVYRDLPAPERSLRHEQAARVLQAAGASDEQVAAHLMLAPRRGDDRAVGALRRAARTAADRGATDSAVTYLRRALEELPDDAQRCEVLGELGLLEALLDGSASAEHLAQAYVLERDPRRRARLAVATARTHVFASPPGIATAFARQAAADLPEELTDHRQALLALEMTSGYMHALDPAGWRRALPEPEGDGYGAQMLAAALAFDTTVAGVDRPRAVQLARFALEGDRLWKVDNGLFWVVAAIIRTLADDDLGDFWSRARAEAYARGSLFAAMSTNLWQGFWHWRRGDLDEADSCLGTALEQDRMWGGAGAGTPYAQALRIGCHLDRGDLPAARRVADAALARQAFGDGARLVGHAIARLLAVEGRPAEALAALDAVPTPVPVPNPVWNPWRPTAALALRGLGRTDEAVALMEDEVRLQRRWGAPSHLGGALRLLGELRGRDGLPELREAVALLAPTSAAVDLARARCSLGSRADVPHDEAVPLLVAAIDEAHARGAVAVRERARAALGARGCPDDEHRGTVRRPSVTERRILDLTAAGFDVRQVAQQLLLTPGTVRAAVETWAGVDPGRSGTTDRTAVGGIGLKSLASPPTDRVPT
ncbi:AAA family ATPase [Geodermatophilus sp. YIM 151500]|uniref:BTAD domain-containing putative transcriptional regulator n=1 Tax=Geodermatophilus sp. YIM 151500 TaxID=2984531 RepID=UPI0021E49FBE|nr:BTAD domain-containing putative transcriptional regulator [Geodermatophilus sp. YIM 151500]MCV2491623.1 AAA family ATPase [Geodermatophilus sp. YIM 151500]